MVSITVPPSARPVLAEVGAPSLSGSQDGKTTASNPLALEALVNVPGSIQQSSRADEPYPIQFDFVQRNPLNEQAWQKRLTAGVHDTIEHVRDGQNNREYMLTVVTEYLALNDAEGFIRA